MGLDEEFARSISDLIALPDEEAAPALNRRMKAILELESMARKTFAERGLIADEFQKRQLYKFLGYRTFSDWVCSGFLDAGRSSIYASLRLVKDLKQHMPIDVISQVKEKGNLITLAQCDEPTRKNPGVQAAAMAQPAAEFISHIQEHHPGQNIESRVAVRFYLTRSQADFVEDALKATIDAEGVGSREAALEVWAAEAATDYSEARKSVR